MKICKACKETFVPAKKITIFCSWSCYQLDHKATLKECVCCKKKAKGINKYCSRVCFHKFTTGKIRSHGKKRIDSVGYITVPTGSSMRKREHVLIWEAFHKQEVPKGWVVHHKNEIRTDNRIENLEAMPRGDHQRLHKIPRKPCKVCGKPQNARSLCSTHYTQWKRKEFGRCGSMFDSKNKPQWVKKGK